MASRRHSKESIIQTLQNLARELGKNSLSKKDINPIIPESSVCKHFGSIGNALEAAGLERKIPGGGFLKGPKAISDDELFQSLLEVEKRSAKNQDSMAILQTVLIPVRLLRKGLESGVKSLQIIENGKLNTR